MSDPDKTQHFELELDENEYKPHIGWKIFFFPEHVIHLGGQNNRKLGIKYHKFATESGYIYFRKNYGIISVLSAYLFDSMFHLLQAGKRIIFFKKNINLREEIQEGISEFRILIGTKFGNNAIN